MIVLVSDTSALIDLERGGCLDCCFRLPFEFAVPDLLYKRELANYGGAELIRHGLRVEDLSKEELMFVQQIRHDVPKLSIPDAYAFSLAARRHWTLLTGDGALRDLARSQAVPFHGVLWVFDQLFDAKVMEVNALMAGLDVISAHPRCRLPKNEIQTRIHRYRGEGGV